MIRPSLSSDKDPHEGRVEVVENKTFYLSFFESRPTKDRVKFTVRGKPYGKFPHPVALTLNNEEICKIARRWNPAIIGLSWTGETDDDKGIVFPDSDGPFPDLFHCGKPKFNREELVTNGFDTKPGEYPWHVAIFHRERRSSSSYKCGGTIINPTTILTAGHCVFDTSGRVLLPERVTVQLGRHQLYTPESNVQEFQVYQIKLHPHYDKSTLENDLAVFKMADAITFTNYIQPICMWDREATSIHNLENERGTVMGWGYTELDELSDVLKQATMPVVPLGDCLVSNRDFFGAFLTNKNFCAGYRNGTSVCNGDSGGGMIFQVRGLWFLRGVVSLSMKRDTKDLCNTSHYVIFTDVAKYLDWIESESA